MHDIPNTRRIIDLALPRNDEVKFEAYPFRSSSTNGKGIHIPLAAGDKRSQLAIFSTALG